MELCLFEVKSVLRNILITSPLPINISALEHDFEDIMGIKIPYQKFGFQSLLEFLNSIPDVLTVSGNNEFSGVHLVSSEKFSQLSDRVTKQKVSNKRTRNFNSEKKTGTRNSKEVTDRQSNNTPKSSKSMQSKEKLRFEKPVRLDGGYPSQMSKKSNNLKDKCSNGKNSTNSGIEIVSEKKSIKKFTKKSAEDKVNLKASAECFKVENISPEVRLSSERYSNSFSEEYPGCTSTNEVTRRIKNMKVLTHENSKRVEKSCYCRKDVNIPENNISIFEDHTDARKTRGRTQISVGESGNSLKNKNNHSKTQEDKKKKFDNKKNPVVQKNKRDSIPEHVKQNLQKLILDFPDGIWCAELPIAYKNLFVEEIPYQKYGFLNLIHLCLDLDHIFHCVKESSYDYKLYDAKKPLHEVKIEEDHIFNEETRNTTERPPASPDMFWGCFDFCVPEDAMKLGFRMDRIQVADLFTSRMEVDVLVSEIYDISKFWIIFNFEKLHSLMKDLKKFYNSYEIKQKYQIHRSFLEAGLNCVVLYEGVFYRAVIVNRMTNENYVEVYFFDYGTLGTVPKYEIWYLVSQFVELPMQAIRSRLADVYPPYVRSAWSPSATDEFRTLTCMKKLKATIVKVDRKKNVCDLKLKRGNQYISNILIAKNHAISIDQPQKKHIEDPNCELKVEFVHLLPEFEEIENWESPSKDC